ncbi:Histone-lysine N-methyltransferase, H3 lysine-9 specific SUVH3 [Apostasia shenzhenica]|uniref:Histone-lysine N-methyltransferase, H3 lysine-9 specific SUVH3 n=1 Tax=Apostasia shenzhenica TaxID=1088818 RepID=A0A2I0AQZ3_9ASPA|nr:Histone-lysine N-methyltransferase, H3 lysine-9 specific SUVH3 [Apostasia shenzhenica]
MFARSIIQLQALSFVQFDFARLSSLFLRSISLKLCFFFFYLIIKHCCCIFLITSDQAMEARLNSTTSSSSSTQSEVLDVEPLRSLAPMLPSLHTFNRFPHPTFPSLVCITPFGSFASCFESKDPPSLFPLYPTFVASEKPSENPFGDSCENHGSDAGASPRAAEFSCPSQMAIVPLNEQDTLSIDTTHSCQKRSLSYLMPGERKKAKRKSVKRAKNGEMLLPSSLGCSRESVEVILMTFDALRRWLVKLDEVNDKEKKHPHLRAGRIMNSNDLRMNNVKRVGHVPGVEVGDIFYFRTEMCLIGLHLQNVAGIDYKYSQIGDEDDNIAVSIVASGGYENEDDNVDVLVYSGQGRPKKNGNEIDQKLERGNLALERSLHRSNAIRVIRTEKDSSSHSGKVYIYDGLYKIIESWVDKSKSGTNVFKYKLLREPDQPDGVGVWRMVKRWKENSSSRGNLISHDISFGSEAIPICLVNEVDGERGLSPFSYTNKINYPSIVRTMGPLQGCMCNGTCLPGDVNCSCSKRNGGFLPYNSNGSLVNRSTTVYECNPRCLCSTSCRNRVTQKGVKLHFEVFKTKDRGWGLKSWDPIRAGAFICEYIGKVIEKIKIDEEDEFVFQPLAGEKTFKWNHGPELIGETGCIESIEAYKLPPITMSAKNEGNISRFMNHSCSPNVFWQPVQHDHDDEDHPHIMFFAMKHIPPMTELTYDCGLSVNVTDGEQMGTTIGSQRTKKCLCGSSKCIGLFG